MRAARGPPVVFVAALHGDPCAWLRLLAAFVMTTPALSVVVIAYDMARELPRTLQTLAPPYQRGIDADAVEILVVDNGSRRPFDRDDCARRCPNAQFHYLSDAGASPVAAINHGLALARGDLIGVMIDGARMASPGLLAAACQAARLHPRPVIGTLAFHLGPDVQMRSVAAGYDQATEDRLLASIDWEADGYRLFEIAVPGASSSRGWFVLPPETNALFMKRAQWQALGGYDPAFVTPGGGLANLDTWARACADPEAEVVLLLGEATFHQVHGGVATNAVASPYADFLAEFHRIRGHAFRMPVRAPLFVGRVPPPLHPSLAASIAPLALGPLPT
jgi:hypothetical protein